MRDQGGEDHQQDRGHQYQRDHELDLRRRPGGPLLDAAAGFQLAGFAAIKRLSRIEDR